MATWAPAEERRLLHDTSYTLAELKSWYNGRYTDEDLLRYFESFPLVEATVNVVEEDPWNEGGAHVQVPHHASTAESDAAQSNWNTFVPNSSWSTSLPVVSSAPVVDDTTFQRQRDFYSFQQDAISRGILPAKTLEELQEENSAVHHQTIGIDFDLYESVTRTVSGPKSENMPDIFKFSELYEQFGEYIPAELQANMERCGYVRPTPVQRFAMPAALLGRDVMCCAQTGSGKTVAFLVPVLASMMKHHRATGGMEVPFQGPCRPDTVILSPTRELCLQIFAESQKLCKGTPYRAIRVYGQEPTHVQLKQAARGADLVIATPGRLWDFVNSDVLQVKDVQCLVIDEADRMIEFSMEKWVRAIVDDHGMPDRTKRQTLMFSATFPDEIQRLASDYLFEHLWIAIGVVGGAVCTVKQELHKVHPAEKMNYLVDIVNDFLETRTANERMMVFTNFKAQAKGLDEKLYDLHKIDTGALHGDLTQKEREANLTKFRAGLIDVMIATDVASRGLDIAGVSHVVNYDLPRSIDVYVQRIGRTGRIGHRGKAITFIAVDSEGKFIDEAQVLQDLVSIMVDAESEVPPWFQQHVGSIMNTQNAHLARSDLLQEESADHWGSWTEASAATAQVVPFGRDW